MRGFLVAVLLFLAVVALAVDPIAKNENNILYEWDGLWYEIYQGNLFVVSVTESMNGVDSMAIWWDVDIGTYKWFEIWAWASMTEDNTAGDEQADAIISFYPYMDYTSSTEANRLVPQSFNAGETGVGSFLYTLTSTDSTSGAREFQVGTLLPGETLFLGRFITDATASFTDSLGYALEALTSDSGEVTFTLWICPREL